MNTEQDVPIPDRPIYTPPGGPPQTDGIPPRVFEAMGEERIMAMAREFYERLGRSEAAHLFPTDPVELAEASRKTGALFMFLFGGPPVYQRQHGPPRLRMRHLPFRIDEGARREWVRCLRETLAGASENHGMPEDCVEVVDRFFDTFSRWMVNTSPEEESHEP